MFDGVGRYVEQQHKEYCLLCMLRERERERGRGRRKESPSVEYIKSN
jgi:hypothetical protein